MDNTTKYPAQKLYGFRKPTEQEHSDVVEIVQKKLKKRKRLVNIAWLVCTVLYFAFPVCSNNSNMMVVMVNILELLIAIFLSAYRRKLSRGITAITDREYDVVECVVTKIVGAKRVIADMRSIETVNLAEVTTTHSKQSVKQTFTVLLSVKENDKALLVRGKENHRVFLCELCFQN